MRAKKYLEWRRKFMFVYQLLNIYLNPTRSQSVGKGFFENADIKIGVALGIYFGKRNRFGQ